MATAEKPSSDSGWASKVTSSVKKAVGMQSKDDSASSAPEVAGSLKKGKPSTLEIPEGPQASEAPATPGVTLHQPRQATSPGSVTSENAPTPGDKESEIGSPRSHAIQGERVQVERLGGPGEAALAAVGEGEEITTVDARPDFEVESMAAADVASIKQQEAALVAAQRQQELEEKEGELQRLKEQAETLEVDAEGLLAQASLEKLKVDQAEEKRAEIEGNEAALYGEAEAAEKERRAVVARARPIAAEAEARERDAAAVKAQAADTEYHAQVLEARSRALLAESEELKTLSESKAAEAELFAAELTIVEQEREEIATKAASIHSGDLPARIQANQVEIGVLSARIKKLRDEIEWAEAEVRKVRADADDWQRIAARKKHETAGLTLRISEAREAARLALERSREAAEEARAPSEFAEAKYGEAAELAKRAEALEAEAAGRREEALAVLGDAAAPVALRQEKLREAAEAEAAARALEAHVALVRGRVDRRLYESHVRTETAAVKRGEAGPLEAEVERARAETTQHEEAAEEYGAQAERHLEAGPAVVAAN
ncbi:hypothetical protein F751_3400 [Auxenochlorella protothecoides]|uniref:Uncharacterized protein n=1 Tax=Auxenochlorella protothecoides TaxID=3075 RepID=A0A087SBV5_AUXPR|nr:hypothetical protein F751_3400 [Auxenochlorella protothecoides]KFM23209.1 hypothetical protein F751_3400 [Auxenochlorella protothecoides]